MKNQICVEECRSTLWPTGLPIYKPKFGQPFMWIMCDIRIAVNITAFGQVITLFERRLAFAALS